MGTFKENGPFNFSAQEEPLFPKRVRVLALPLNWTACNLWGLISPSPGAFWGGAYKLGGTFNFLFEKGRRFFNLGGALSVGAPTSPEVEPPFFGGRGYKWCAHMVVGAHTRELP